jgi:hypothetical protein
MQILYDDKIYQKVAVYDYQAVCYEDRNVEYDLLMDIVSSASYNLVNPFKHFITAVLSLLSSLIDFAIASKAFIPNCKLV